MVMTITTKNAKDKPQYIHGWVLGSSSFGTRQLRIGGILATVSKVLSLPAACFTSEVQNDVFEAVGCPATDAVCMAPVKAPCPVPRAGLAWPCCQSFASQYQVPDRPTEEQLNPLQLLHADLQASRHVVQEIDGGMEVGELISSHLSEQLRDSVNQRRSIKYKPGLQAVDLRQPQSAARLVAERDAPKDRTGPTCQSCPRALIDVAFQRRPRDPGPVATARILLESQPGGVVQFCAWPPAFLAARRSRALRLGLVTPFFAWVPMRKSARLTLGSAVHLSAPPVCLAYTHIIVVTRTSGSQYLIGFQHAGPLTVGAYFPPKFLRQHSILPIGLKKSPGVAPDPSGGTGIASETGRDGVLTASCCQEKAVI
ncbi:hypothetical protein DHEL01_v206765 [Diaporthe helianthi]|uniref:Uncharacterized protein n=1 Tax=Diaporthe helianthi TaxID=158607 RepID=A0A2P5HX56_DIAHE|nr:hypothetical protein DHEL01_v206765 [Diaporthe helianthi]